MNQVITLFQANPTFYITTIVLVGLVVGSFLNVVIYRLPIMMENEWRAQCTALLNTAPEQNGEVKYPERFDLILPGSRCPHCKRDISAFENIPVLSYLWLKGRCSRCQHRIPLRYPIIELTTGVLSGVVAWHFGPNLTAVAALLLTWALICLSVIDFDHQLLPDSITLPVLWLGLALSLVPVFADPRSSIIGAIAGYLSLWSVYMLFKILTGKEGMGHGDFKLLAMFGAWLGWQSLLVIILFSSLVGAVVGLSLVALKGRDKNIPIPFGPYLAIAGWIALLWGDRIMDLYLHSAGLR